MKCCKILVFNPKVAATKLAVFQGSNMLFLKTIHYPADKLASFRHVNEQVEMRKNAILKELQDNDIAIESIEGIIARGGLLKPLESGVYRVNERMKEDLLSGASGTHVTNLGGIIADEIAKLTPNAQAFIADPVVVDELDDLARITGHPLFERRSVFHALNHKVVARKYAKSLHRNYEDMNLIVVHFGGGGVSVGAHRNGRVVDTNQAFDGEGPFSIERSGSLPAGDLVRLCFSGKYSQEEVIAMITAKGGIFAHLGTYDMDEVENRIRQGDEHALLITQAMTYQIAKQIGALCVVFREKPDAIILSGEVFHHSRFTAEIVQRVEKIAPVVIYPDEDEIEAMAMNALGVLKGEIVAKDYV
jgi:butyrate kinase